MNIRDMIIELDQMCRNNREYSKQKDREACLQSEDEAARLTMDILHHFELAGVKSAGAAITALRIYPVLLDESKTQSYEIAGMKRDVARLKSEKLILAKLLRATGMALTLSCDHGTGELAPEKDLNEILILVSEAVAEMRRSVGSQKGK